MRGHARMVYTLAGLALIVPAGARAGMPIMAGAPWSPAQQRASMASSSESRNPERLCADCQRSRVMAQQGVNIPPPPPLPPGTVVKKHMCSACGRPAAVVGGRLARSWRPGESSEPGRAVVGGEADTMLSGNDPAPISAFASRPGAAAPAGWRDGSVMPTSSPSDPLLPNSHSSPHVISHLLGLSAIGRDRAERWERRNEEKHARISYGPTNAQPVQNLPASMVYKP